jgi:hypothetical protein
LGDTVSLSQSGHFVDKHAGLNKAVVATNSLSGADAANYAVNQPSYVTATISRAALGLSGLTAADKVYNADTDAVVTGAPVVTALGADSVTLTGTAVGQFNDKNVGVGKAVLLSGLSIDTTTGDGANYVLPTNIGMTASINQRDLTVSNTIVASKVYDATTTASVSGGSLVGVQGADVLVLSQSGSFADKDAGTGKAVTIADSIAGAAKDNYHLIQPSNVTGNIMPASLTLSGLTANDKTYDGTTTASLTGSAIAEPLGADQVTVSGVPTAVFASANAGTAVPVTIANLSLSGADAGNYTVAAITGVSANIDPAPLTASVNAFTKVYDGNTQAAPSLVLTGWVGSDSHLAVQAASTLNSKDVLTATQLVVDSVVLSNGSHGELASNYSLSAGQTGAATVTPAPLTATVSAPNKVYDGNTTATPSLSISAGLVNGEQVGVSGTASFNANNVLTANLVTVDSVTLSDGVNGELASNYSLSTGQTTPAQITPASLTVTDVATATAVTGSFKPGAAVLVGVIGADQVTGSVSLDSPDYSSPGFLKVGDYKQAVNTLSGEDAGNYVVAAFTTALANYTVTALPVKASVAQTIAVAALTQLPSRANTPTAVNPASSNASSGVSSANSSTATANAGANASQNATANASSNANSNPQSSATQTSNARNQGPVTATELSAIQNTPANNANTRSPNLLQASLQVPVRGSTAVAPSLNLFEPSLVTGFNELDLDFSAAPPAAPGLPDVFANTPSSLDASPTTANDVVLDWEDSFYAGVREVIQSPLTYQVLTGASSVAFLVKTLLPTWLPSFQVPGSLPNPAPVRVPTSPGSMASGRTSIGRWLGRA